MRASGGSVISISMPGDLSEPHKFRLIMMYYGILSLLIPSPLPPVCKPRVSSIEQEASMINAPWGANAAASFDLLLCLAVMLVGVCKMNPLIMCSLYSRRYERMREIGVMSNASHTEHVRMDRGPYIELIRTKPLLYSKHSLNILCILVTSR